MKTKIIYTLTILLLGLQLKAQSPLTAYGLPTGTTLDKRLKADMKVDPSGNIWVAFTGRKLGSTVLVSEIGLAKFDGSVWTTYNTTNSSIPTNYITSLEFNGNILWMGTKKGLVKKDNETFTVYNKANSGIISDSINDVKIKNGIVWIATDNGISKWDGATWTNYSKANSTIISDLVSYIDVDNAGNVWCGTSAGVSKLDNGGVFTNYTTDNSELANNAITAVYTDTKGRVWISVEAPFSQYPEKGYSGIYMVVNGQIKSILEGLNLCGSVNLPPAAYSITSDASGKVYMQGIEVAATNPPALYQTVLEISDQGFKSYPLKSFQIHYLASGTFYQVDGTGNLWYISRDGGGLDSLYKYNRANYITPPPNKLENNAGSIEYLNVNKVSTPILNRGDMFWDLSNGEYEVPKGSCKRAVFASSMWIGGTSNGNIKMAAQTYRQSGNDFWPGPLSNGTGSIDSITSASYDKIWKVNRWMIDEFKANYAQPGYQIPDAILTWPAHGDVSKGQSANLAPFVNVGGLPDKYEPHSGDYPLIKGDQMLYWIFNDKLIHSETQGVPLGVEIHASAYAFNCDDIHDNDSNTAINYTTFYHYDIFNKSTETIDSLTVGLWTDVDLGNYADDYVGCNPKEGYGFVYNGDPVDEGWSGYGENPPALAVVQLKGVSNSSGDDQGMGLFEYYNNDFSQMGNPTRPEHYWNYLNSRWKDGTSVTYGGSGRGGSEPSKYMFPGNDDINGRPEWTETTAGNVPGDRRFLMATGPVGFPPGATQSIDYAFVYSRTSSSASPVLPKLKNDVNKVKNWFLNNTYPTCSGVNGIADVNMSEVKKLLVYPNPASNLLSVQYVAKAKNATYEIYDLTGKRVLNGNITESSNNFSVQSLTPGLYIIKLVDAGEVHSAKFMKQ